MSRPFSHGPIDFRSMPVSLQVLALTNVAAFFLTWLVGGPMYDLFGLVPAHVWRDRWAWQVVTYLFLHGNGIHLLFNLLALWMFAMPIQAEWGEREFVKYFFLCGVGSGIVSALVQPGSLSPIIGASGAVYGLLVAFAMLYPDAVVYLYFFFPIRAKHMAVLFGLLEFFAGTAGTTPGIARFTHLSGMLIGWVYIRWWWILKVKFKAFWAGISFGPLSGGRPAPRGSAGGGRPSKSRAERSEPDAMAEVDRILDKISAYGQESLSPEELEILKRISKKGRQGHA